jgi:hypothetical protein
MTLHVSIVCTDIGVVHLCCICAQDVLYHPAMLEMQ